MKGIQGLIILLFLFLGFNSIAQERDTTQLYKVVKHDGIEYIGKILSDDGREVLILTEELGKIYIPKSEIKSIHLIEHPEKIFKGNYREVGPFTTRYYFTNNALPITKGEDYAMIHLYGPEVHFALSDKFSLGVMATWMASPIGIAAKYSFKTNNEKLNFSLGTIMLSSGYLFQAKGWGGLHWTNITYGKPGKNINFSAGFCYIDLGFGLQNEYEKGFDRMKKGPLISIAGITPVGVRASFIFDSMIALTEHRNYRTYYSNSPGDSYYDDPIVLYESGNKISALLMPGMRFQKTDRRAFQVALAGVIEYSDVGFQYDNSDDQKVRSFPFPMCSWFLKF